MTYPHQEWLESVCSTDPARPDLHQPNRCDGWVFGTNGHVLVAVADDGREAGDLPGASKILGGLKVEGGTTFSLSALREWAGVIEGPCPDCDGAAGPCSACAGTGEIDCECICGHEHEAECRVCRGSGKAPPLCSTCKGKGEADEDSLDRIGTFETAPFNRRKLALLLAKAPDGEVTVVVDEGFAQYRRLILNGEGWSAILVAIREGHGLSVVPEPMEPLALEAV